MKEIVKNYARWHDITECLSTLMFPENKTISMQLTLSVIEMAIYKSVIALFKYHLLSSSVLFTEFKSKVLTW